MSLSPRRRVIGALAAFGTASLAVSGFSMADELEDVLPWAWTSSEQRVLESVDWMEETLGNQAPTRFPNFGNLATGRWNLAANTWDWRNGFWCGVLWMLAQRTGDEEWRQRAIDWTATLAETESDDHDIGFIVLTSFGKGLLFHDEVNDPGGTYRETAKAAIFRAAEILDARFNSPNAQGTPVPAGFTRSWNTPFEDPYPVCIDNLMNLELLLMAYELGGRQEDQRHWFDHAVEHARSSIAKHMRPDGGSYHVVRHFESGPQIGQVERKCTLQGYGDETTWSRGQGWIIHGLTTVYRYASRDPGTDASDILAAAEKAADYFIDHLPDHYIADVYNHRPGDFVPPVDFDASLGEPVGPWNDANNNYNSSTGTGLGDRRLATSAFAGRDTSAASLAASGLIELSQFVASPEDRERYLSTAKQILLCLITYDGPDSGHAPDYFCSPYDTANPGILKAGVQRWNDPSQSLIYGDFYFLEALARYEALVARKLIVGSQRFVSRPGSNAVEFTIQDPAPSLGFRILRSPDLSPDSWVPVASRMGCGPWSGAPVFQLGPLPGGKAVIRFEDPTGEERGFYRIETRSAGVGE